MSAPEFNINMPKKSHELKTAQKLIQQQATTISLLSTRLRDMDELLAAIHERLVNAGHHDCEHCLGTGGVAEGCDVLSRDGWEISHTETIGWSAPSEEECDSCHGTGIEFK